MLHAHTCSQDHCYESELYIHTHTQNMVSITHVHTQISREYGAHQGLGVHTYIHTYIHATRSLLLVHTHTHTLTYTHTCNHSDLLEPRQHPRSSPIRRPAAPGRPCPPKPGNDAAAAAAAAHELCIHDTHTRSHLHAACAHHHLADARTDAHHDESPSVNWLHPPGHLRIPRRAVSALTRSHNMYLTTAVVSIVA